MNVCVLACARTQILQRTIAQVADSVAQDDGPVFVLKHVLCEHHWSAHGEVCSSSMRNQTRDCLAGAPAAGFVERKTLF